MHSAVETADRSVHAGVPCLACHREPGAAGAVTYVPTLAREIGNEIFGGAKKDGVLAAVPCTKCHADVLRDSKKNPHPHGAGASDCASCHGNVDHPTNGQPAGSPHPAGYIQTHGRDVVGNAPLGSASAAAKCSTCHSTTFCTACHFLAGYPHPANWIDTHGQVEEQDGIKACNLCHAESFCESCHGTAIPHPANWLSQHYIELRGKSVAPCLVCHPQSDCTTCHTLHAEHNEQNLFGGPAPT
jgi:hypothetical protein